MYGRRFTYCDDVSLRISVGTWNVNGGKQTRSIAYKGMVCEQHYFDIAFCTNAQSELQEKARTTEEDLEEASGRGNTEDWFEGGCPKSSKVEKLSASNCGRTGVNPAISKGTIPDKN